MVRLPRNVIGTRFGGVCIVERVDPSRSGVAVGDDLNSAGARRDVGTARDWGWQRAVCAHVLRKRRRGSVARGPLLFAHHLDGVALRNLGHRVEAMAPARRTGALGADLPTA